MAVRSFSLPDLGEGLQEAEIIEWHVSVGDRVVADQPLVSVETDKAVVEVPSPWSGTVTTLCAEPGDILNIGDLLAEVDDGGRADQGAIVGSLEPETIVGTAEKPRKPPPMPATSQIRAAPAVRAHAREMGVDLADIKGTGAQGIITRTDVDAAAGGRPSRNTGARRSMARAMAKAHASVVPATVMDVAEITPWYDPATDVTVRLVRAVCAAATAEPALNTWYDPKGEFDPQPPGVALGIAVDTQQGLYVPAIADAETLSPDQLRTRLDDLIARVRGRRAAADTAQRPTITLSNFGAIGGRHAALVVAPPQVAILGAGRAYETAAWRNGAAARAVNLPLSLTFDHRAATGGEAARFLAAAVADLEMPE